MSRISLIAEITDCWGDKADLGWEIAQDIVAEMGFNALTDAALSELADRSRSEACLAKDAPAPHPDQLYLAV